MREISRAKLPASLRADYSAADLSSITYDALRCRAVGTCFSQHATEQKRSLSRPVLHEATVHRIAEAPIGISLRHVAQTKLAMANT